MSKRYSRLMTALVQGLTAPQRPWRRANTRLLVANALLQRHLVDTRHGPLVFVTTHPEALQFPRNLAGREPETIEWIDSFKPPCTFWDVGANIGTYALYAALRPGIEALAFEPSAASYAALCRNIEANGLDERVRAFAIALSGQTRLGSLNMSATNAGNSFNSFESTENCFGNPIEVTFRQASVGFSIDEFRRLFELPPPNYLKIDVDGTEAAILDGAATTLGDPALRAVLIELEVDDTARNAAIVARLEAAGFAIARRGVVQHGGSVNAIFGRAASAVAAPPGERPQAAIAG
jgi:FkbM family methyltransferase